MSHIGSEFGPILGLNEYAQTYLGVEAGDFDFDYGIQHSDWYIDQLRYLSLLEVFKSLEEDLEAINFTLFHRPPPFPKRRSGQFILTTAASVLVALSIPIYNYVYDHYTKVAIVLLEKRLQEVGSLATQLRIEVTRLEKEKKSLQKKLDHEKELLQTKSKVLDAVYKKKVDYPMKAAKIVEFANEMRPYRVKIVALENVDNNFTFSLVAKSDKQITEYIRHLTDKYADTMHADIEKIVKDGNKSLYYGDLKVVLP
jgi:hypothetical protein